MSDIDELRRQALANVRRLVREHHPDVNHSPTAARETRLLGNVLKLMRKARTEGSVSRSDLSEAVKDWNEGKE